MKAPRQQQLGLVEEERKPLSPSQRELVRRAGTNLSLQQRLGERRRLRAEEAAHLGRKAAEPTISLPHLRRMP